MPTQTETQLYLGMAATDQIESSGYLQTLVTEFFDVHGYVRQQVVIDPVTGTNTNTITFPEFGRDVEAKHFGIFTGQTGGNMVAEGAAEPIQVGKWFQFDVGTVQLVPPFFVQRCLSATDPQQSGIVFSQDGRVLGTIKQLDVAGAIADATVSGDQGYLNPVTPFTINAFTVTPLAGELGVPVTEVVLNWSYQGHTPTSQTLNGEVIPATARTFTLSDLELTARTTFTLAGTKDSKTTTKVVVLEIQPRIYWGTSTDAHLTSAIGSGALKPSVAGSYSFPKGSPYYYFMAPAQFSVNRFVEGMFDFSMNPPYQITINSINYNVYRSTHELTGYTGAITLIVS